MELFQERSAELSGKLPRTSLRNLLEILLRATLWNAPRALLRALIALSEPRISKIESHSKKLRQKTEARSKTSVLEYILEQMAVVLEYILEQTAIVLERF